MVNDSSVPFWVKYISLANVVRWNQGRTGAIIATSSVIQPVVLETCDAFSVLNERGTCCDQEKISWHHNSLRPLGVTQVPSWSRAGRPICPWLELTLNLVSVLIRMYHNINQIHCSFPNLPNFQFCGLRSVQRSVDSHALFFSWIVNHLYKKILSVYISFKMRADPTVNTNLTLITH